MTEPSRFATITGLARPIDLSVPSNRFAVVLAAVAVAVTWPLAVVVGDAGVVAGLGRAAAVGVGAFLAWAIGRETDPDHPDTARLAGVLFAALAWIGAPALAGLFALLLAVRLVARTTGHAPTLVDLVVLVAVAGLAARTASGFTAALAIAVGLYLDTRHARPASSRNHVAAGAAGVAAVAVTILAGGLLQRWTVPSVPELVLAVAVLAASFRLRAGQVRSVADLTGQPLDTGRVTAARRLLVGTLAGALLWSGGGAVAALLPAVTAILATAGLAAYRARAHRARAASATRPG